MQAGDRALYVADLLLRADCICCVKERRQLAARCYYLLLGAAFPAGNLMEACRLKWVVDRLTLLKAFPLCARYAAPKGFPHKVVSSTIRM